MPRKTSLFGILMLTTCVFASDRYVQVIHQFGQTNSDGAYPGALISDKAGNVYGTTYDGGAGGYGTVFELSPPAQTGGEWTETILADFAGPAGGPDGSNPIGPLTMNARGDLFGITFEGGTSGYGTVYEIAHNSDGSWSKNILYSFTGGSDGGIPTGNLVLDAQGSLYGVTVYGGNDACYTGCGVVFQLKPNGSGGWDESVIHSFLHDADGYGAGWLAIRSGKLYGTTNQTGVVGVDGTIFEMTRAGGVWNLSTIYSFAGGSEGMAAASPFLFDSEGNIYSTTESGGSDQLGEVFELSPPALGSGSWTKTSLYSFAGGTDGTSPYGLILGKDVRIVGLTGGGVGCSRYDGCGTIFQLDNSGGTWTKSTLCLFSGALESPVAGLAFTPAGLIGSIGERSNLSGAVYRLY
jgi:uncharacterized repeat protein (TIGR03803 family)